MQRICINSDCFLMNLPAEGHSSKDFFLNAFFFHANGCFCLYRINYIYIAQKRTRKIGQGEIRIF